MTRQSGRRSQSERRPDGEIKAPPEVGGIGAECILGVCLAGELVYMLLDIDNLLDAVDCALVQGDDRKMEGPA